MIDEISVLLVDDHALVRRGFHRILEDDPYIRVVGEASDGMEAIEMAQKLRPRVVVMDLAMPKLDGVQATAAVREACPDVAVVCLTASANTREVEALYEAGASACLTKDQELEDIVDAIKRAAGRLPADGA